MCVILTTASSHGKKYIMSCALELMEKERKYYKYVSIFSLTLSLHWKKNMWLDYILLIDNSLTVLFRLIVT